MGLIPQKLQPSPGLWLADRLPACEALRLEAAATQACPGHSNAFAWVGSFGAAIRGESVAQTYGPFLADPKLANQRLQLLWIGSGRADSLFPANRALHDALAAKGIVHVFHESTGGHTWVNWRGYFIEFLPRPFQPAIPAGATGR